MEARLITITIHRQESREARSRREAAKRRVAFLVAAAVVLLLLTLCWWTSRQKRAEAAGQVVQVTSEPAVQVIRLNEDVSEPAGVVTNSAESGTNQPETDHLTAIQDCTITYFCAERYPHICGTGDGITATGTTAEPGTTCAVDPAVIPLGSVVLVDFGDGVLYTYRAEDVGGAVAGNHIDLCVASHREAETLGVMKATVYWKKP